jgi:hypothetical protein
MKLECLLRARSEQNVRASNKGGKNENPGSGDGDQGDGGRVREGVARMVKLKGGTATWL